MFLFVFVVNRKENKIRLVCKTKTGVKHVGFARSASLLVTSKPRTMEERRQTFQSTSQLLLVYLLTLLILLFIPFLHQRGTKSVKQDS